MPSLFVRAAHALKAARLTFSRYGGTQAGDWAAWRGDLWGDANAGPVGQFLPGTKYDYRTAAGDLAQNSAVQACIAWMQRTFPEPRLRVVKENADDEEEEIKRHPLTLLLAHPNPAYSGDHLWHRTLPDWVTCGNAYWVKVRNGAGRVIQLWQRPAAMIRPVRDTPSDFISRYVYRVDGRETSYKPADVVHFRFGVDPGNEMLGWTPLLAGVREVAGLNNGANYRGALLRNQGTPGYGLTITDIETAKELANKPQSFFDGLRSKFRQLFSGDGAGGLFIPSFPSKLERLGFSPQELDILDMLAWDTDMVCALLGLNSMTVNLPSGKEHRTYANQGDAREAAFECCILPLQKLMGCDLDSQLLADFGNQDQERVSWDYRTVRVLQPDEDKKWARLVNALAKGGITRARFKTLVGEKPETDGSDEVYYIPNGVQVVKVGEEQPNPSSPALPPGTPPESQGDQARGELPPIPPNGSGRVRIPVKAWSVEAVGESLTFKYNPHHDPHSGEFSSGGAGGSSGAADTAAGKLSPHAPRAGFRNGTAEDRTRLGMNAKAFPQLHVNETPGAAIEAIGWRANGTNKYKYSAAHIEAQHAAKFERQRAFHAELPELSAHIEADRQGGKRTNEAGVLFLQHRMGFRIGGDETQTAIRDKETGAVTGHVTTYGAATLRKEHVKVAGDTVHFDFIGKGNERQQHESRDPELVAFVKERLNTPGERLFNTNERKVRSYLGEIDGDFIPHDFRTWNATAGARDLVEKMPRPTNQKELKASIKAVSEHIGKRLGDKPATVLKNYIDPHVFQDWRLAVGVED